MKDLNIDLPQAVRCYNCGKVFHIFKADLDAVDHEYSKLVCLSCGAEGMGGLNYFQELMVMLMLTLGGLASTSDRLSFPLIAKKPHLIT